MIEPEVAFNDLNDNMDLAEDFILWSNTRWTNVRGFEILETRLLDEEKSKPVAEKKWTLTN
jgi:asparaginyl-tRNA synthetase